MINDFPYTNLHALNLDWILQEIKKLSDMEDQVNEAVEKAESAIEAAEAATEAVSGKLDINHDWPDKFVAYMSYQNIDGIVPFSKSADTETLAWRTDDGTIKAVDPIDDDDVATKSYVDNRALTPEALADVLVGSDTVSVDISEGGDQVVVKLDQDVIDELDGKVDADRSALADAGALTTLATAPASARIVGINAGNRQFSISIGSGLALSGSNVLSATGGGEGGNVPTPEEADAGKVLTVNAGGIGFGWQTPSGNAVQKVTANNILYGRILNEEAALPIATSSADANSIARRGTGGTLVVGNPTSNNHAATKKYVDDSILTVRPWPIALITLTGADTWSSTSDWTEITAAVTYGIIKMNPGSNDWYMPAYAKNMTSSILLRTYNGTAFQTYTINSDGTYTTA